MRKTIAAIILLGPFPCAAFDACLHEAFARRAVERYEACATKLHINRATQRQLDHFAYGTWAEDKTETARRLRNWHYYASGLTRQFEQQPPLPFRSHANLNHVLNIRLNDLFEGPDDEQSRWVIAGRVTHFLQDMRVPAHVIPVHHGPFIGKDGFDGMRMPKLQRDLSQDECATLKEEADSATAESIRARLDSIARATRESIKQPIPGFQCTWEDVFWCDPSTSRVCGAKFQGFGAYRVRSDAFGTLAEVSCNGTSTKMGRAAYERFASPGHDAMLNDVVFMIFVAQRLAPAEEPMEEDESSCPPAE